MAKGQPRWSVSPGKFSPTNSSWKQSGLWSPGSALRKRHGHEASSSRRCGTWMQAHKGGKLTANSRSPRLAAEQIDRCSTPISIAVVLSGRFACSAQRYRSASPAITSILCVTNRSLVAVTGRMLPYWFIFVPFMRSCAALMGGRECGEIWRRRGVHAGKERVGSLFRSQRFQTVPSCQNWRCLVVRIGGACKLLIFFGSSGRTRTYNPSVNSRMLCH